MIYLDRINLIKLLIQHKTFSTLEIEGNFPNLINTTYDK